MNNTRVILKKYLFLLIWSLFSLNVGRTFSSNNFPFLVVLLLGFVLTILTVPQHLKRFSLDKSIWIYFLFVAYSFASCLWADNSDIAITGSLVVLLTLSILVVFYFLIRNTKIEITDLLGYFCLAGIFTYLYLVLRYGISITWSLRSDSFSESGLYNANSVGKIYLLGAIGGYFKAQNTRKSKRLYYFLSICLLFLMLLTASKSNLLTLLMTAFIYTYLLKRSNGEKTLFLILIPFIVGLVYVLIMYVPVLYNLIGHRFLEIFDFFRGDVVQYSSTWYRFSMYQNGIELFLNKPIMGYGMTNAALHNTFEWVYESGVYLHSNYLELLVDLGIVGTVIYYSIYFISLKANIKKMRKGDGVSAMFISFLVATLVSDVTSVSYLNRPIVLMLMTSCLYGNNYFGDYSQRM